MFKPRINLNGLIVTETLPDRFWKKVNKKSDSECWEWTGASYSAGYGCIGIGGVRGKAKMVGTHIISYYMHNGPIENGLCVCHSCDNPPCVNPKHLWLGTHSDNVKDMVKKGRRRDMSGNDNPNRKLTESIVSEIRSLSRPITRKTREELGNKYGVHPLTISAIAYGRGWK